MNEFFDTIKNMYWHTKKIISSWIENHGVRFWRGALLLFISTSVLTVFGAYYDPAFNYEDYISGYFFALLGSASLYALLSTRKINQRYKTHKPPIRKDQY
jgi:uncharacterized membrane protein YfcA